MVSKGKAIGGGICGVTAGAYLALSIIYGWPPFEALAVNNPNFVTSADQIVDARQDATLQEQNKELNIQKNVNDAQTAQLGEHTTQIKALRKNQKLLVKESGWHGKMLKVLCKSLKADCPDREDALELEEP